MPKKDDRSVKLPRPYNHAELQQFASQLNSLAEEFDDHAKRLRTSDAAMGPIAGMRAAMTRAGRMVADLVKHNALAATRPLPPWLAWLNDPRELPEISGWQGAPRSFMWQPSRSLTSLLQAIAAERQVFDRDHVGQPGELEADSLHARLVFVEAAVGWLGRRCTPRQQVLMPVGRVVIGRNPTGLRRDEKHVLVTIDWDGRPLDQLKLFFLELGVASAVVCRHVAVSISVPAGTGPATVTGRLRDAIAEWQRHTRLVPAHGSTAARMILDLSALSPWPEDGVATLPVAFETDPSPTAQTRLRAADDPDIEEFRRISIELAEACGDVAAEFDRHKVDPQPAVKLSRELLKAPSLPTVQQADLVGQILELADVLDIRTARKDGPTIFDLTAKWTVSFDNWQRFLQKRNYNVSSVCLCLPEAPTEEDPIKSRLFALHPAPVGASKQEILNHPGFPRYLAAAHELATRTEPMIGVLRRFGESVGTAHALVRRLRTPDSLPTIEDYEFSDDVLHRLRRVDSIIWRGVLADDEDARERAAFWANERTTLVTQDARGQLDKSVAQIMKKPRDPEHETAVLNLASRLRQQEIFTVPLSEILSQPTSDVSSKCARWIALADYAIRFFLRHDRHRPEVQTIDFSSSVAARNLYPGSVIDGHDLRWAREMVESTRSLQPLAAATGIGADTLLAFTRLELDFDRILKGEAVDIAKHMEEVRVLVKAIGASTSKSAPPKADDWKPSAHQELVLKVLRRAGRLRAGVLWDHIHPKHIEKRAHQNAMKDLVGRKLVGRSGRGRSIEYWAL